MVFRKTNEQSLKEAIHSLLDVYRLNAGIDKVKLQEKWEAIMGPAMSKRARLISFKEGKLIIKVESAALRQELSLSKSKILQRLNSELGKEVIKEVVIV